MKNEAGPGVVDVLVVVLSPVLVAGLTVFYLASWWFTAAWRRVVDHDG